MVGIDELKGLGPVAQGRKIYESKEFNAAFDMQSIWPYNTPQRRLFDGLELDGSKHKDYESIIDYALFSAATAMSEKSRNTINKITNKDMSDLMLNYMQDVLGVKKTLKKEDVDKPAFCASTLSAAADCYDKIAANAMPKLKIQKIRFKGAEKVDRVPTEMLANSILAHHLIFNTYQLINGDELRSLSESAEPMPSYISEAYNVGIKDIKDSPRLALSVDNGNVKAVPFKTILESYEEV